MYRHTEEKREKMHMTIKLTFRTNPWKNPQDQTRLEPDQQMRVHRYTRW